MGLLEAFVDDPLIMLIADEKRSTEAVMNRIQEKLQGKDFGNDRPFSAKLQVETLIEEATSAENLCQMYPMWLPFW
jgi:phosphatidylinositol kinase/protein kinase (PI-3  family)